MDTLSKNSVSVFSFFGGKTYVSTVKIVDASDFPNCFFTTMPLSALNYWSASWTIYNQSSLLTCFCLHFFLGWFELKQTVDSVQGEDRRKKQKVIYHREWKVHAIIKTCIFINGTWTPNKVLKETLKLH